MNIEQMKAVLDTVKAHDKIVIFRHKRPDGDAVGSTQGLCAVQDVQQALFPYSDFAAAVGKTL